MGPNLMTGVRHTVTDRHSDRMPCSHGAETGAVRLQAKNASNGGHQQELKGRKDPLPEPSEGAWTCHLDFGLQAPRTGRAYIDVC